MIVKNSFSVWFYTSAMVPNFKESYDDYGDKIFYTFQELKEIKDKISGIIDNGKGTIKNTLYISKASNIPRYKLKTFINDKKLKKTSLIKNADTVVFDRKNIKDVYNWFNKSTMKKVAIIPLTKEITTPMIQINEEYHKQFPIFGESKLPNILNKTESIIIEEKNYIQYPPEIRSIFGVLKFEDYYELNSYRTQNLSELYDIIKQCLEHHHNNVIWDDEILEQINDDGIDLNDEYLYTLKQMFKSKDKDNILLALEMLNNVNINKHGLQIAMLLNQYRNYFNWGNGINSQAYKTLNNYFINKGILWKEDFRIFLAGLYDNYGDNPQSKSHIESFLKDSINDILRKNKSYKKYFEIQDFNITLHQK
jgi:hypothetical protein